MKKISFVLALLLCASPAAAQQPGPYGSTQCEPLPQVLTTTPGTSELAIAPVPNVEIGLCGVIVSPVSTVSAPYIFTILSTLTAGNCASTGSMLSVYIGTNTPFAYGPGVNPSGGAFAWTPTDGSAVCVFSPLGSPPSLVTLYYKYL